MKLRLLVAFGLLAAILGFASVLVRRPSGGSFFPFRDNTTAPRDTRIKVQVLNATSVRGLARRATDLLRDKGFDVVEVGTSRETADSVVVLDRSGHPDWAHRVAAAMGGGRVESRPDSSRYLDVTVLVGASWRPPAQPFNP
jgi:hypothetical protein